MNYIGWNLCDLAAGLTGAPRTGAVYYAMRDYCAALEPERQRLRCECGPLCYPAACAPTRRDQCGSADTVVCADGATRNLHQVLTLVADRRQYARGGSGDDLLREYGMNT